MGRKMMLALAIPVAALVGYACWPRRADLRIFDPTEMARLETAMWRDYYERRYPALFTHLYESSRAQFGFSPLVSLENRAVCGAGGSDLPADPLAGRGGRRASRPRYLLRLAAGGRAGRLRFARDRIS